MFGELERQAGGVPYGHLDLRTAPSLADQRHPRPLEDRGRPHGARGGRLPPARPSRMRWSWCGNGPRAAALDLEQSTSTPRLGHDPRRRAEVQAGAAEPSVECDQVHARRRARSTSVRCRDGRAIEYRLPTRAWASRRSIRKPCSRNSDRWERRAGVDPFTKIHRTAWRANLGQEPGWSGLDVHIHDPGAPWRMS